MRTILPLLLLATAFSLGCCGLFSETPALPPMNLTFSVALDPSVSLYVVDKDGARITAIDRNEWFYPVQRGLPPGAIYSFRLLHLHASDYAVDCLRGDRGLTGNKGRISA